MWVCSKCSHCEGRVNHQLFNSVQISSSSNVDSPLPTAYNRCRTNTSCDLPRLDQKKSIKIDVNYNYIMYFKLKPVSGETKSDTQVGKYNISLEVVGGGSS